MEQRLLLLFICVLFPFFATCLAFNFDGVSLSSTIPSNPLPSYDYSPSPVNIYQPKPIIIKPLEQTPTGINQLATQTNTSAACYYLEKSPVNITSLKPIMGTWYETHKFNNNETQQRLCEECSYTGVNSTYFLKNAMVAVPYSIMGQQYTKFLAVSGSGSLIYPGVVDIKWQNLATGAPDSLVYMILGTDYKNYLVGYTCQTGENTPEIVIQTRQRNPSREVMTEALSIVKDLGLPLNWVGCVRHPL